MARNKGAERLADLIELETGRPAMVCTAQLVGRDGDTQTSAYATELGFSERASLGMAEASVQEALEQYLKLARFQSRHCDCQPCSARVERAEAAVAALSNPGIAVETGNLH